MLRKPRLLTPGPTELYPPAQLAAAGPIPHHRTEAFGKAVAEVLEGLRYVLQDTRHDVMFVTASGTGAMEAAVSNFFSPRDPVLVARAGKFGDRWLEIARAFGLDVIDLAFPPGDAIDPARVAVAMDGEPRPCGILLQASETSTGVAHPVREIAALARGREDFTVIVDGITALGVMPLDPDGWGLDVVLGASQKALMMPPGLAFLAIGPRAWRRAERAALPRYYFDLRKERNGLRRGQSAYTPAVSLVLALREALAFVRATGREALAAHAAVLSTAVRAAAAALDLELFSKAPPSPAVTAIRAPEGIDSGAIVAAMARDFGITIAGGQDTLKGRIFRIAHLGYCDFADTIAAVAALELVLHRLGHPVRLGAGVRAAGEVWLRHAPAPPGPPRDPSSPARTSASR